MDGYACPTCEHPVVPAAWPEATSLSEAVLGRAVQSDWIEMRRCPGCQALLRRAASEQWQHVSLPLIALLQGGSPSREQITRAGISPRVRDSERLASPV
jgi:hypothetical protein